MSVSIKKTDEIDTSEAIANEINSLQEYISDIENQLQQHTKKVAFGIQELQKTTLQLKPDEAYNRIKKYKESSNETKEKLNFNLDYYKKKLAIAQEKQVKNNLENDKIFCDNTLEKLKELESKMLATFPDLLTFAEQYQNLTSNLWNVGKDIDDFGFYGTYGTGSDGTIYTDFERFIEDNTERIKFFTANINDYIIRFKQKADEYNRKSEEVNV